MSDAAGPEFEQALEGLDFEGALALAEGCEPAVRARLLAKIKIAREEAAQRAGQLAGRIQSLARADHYEGLLALADDPATDLLLRLLAPELQRGARVHLDGARLRRERNRSSAQLRMQAAGDALGRLDPARAAIELGKVDRRWLDEAGRRELDRLRQQAAAARAEQRELTEITGEVLREHQPPPVAPAPDQAPRPRKRLGCLGSLLFALFLITATVLIAG